jgi:signal transduction histidine kinase
MFTQVIGPRRWTFYLIILALVGFALAEAISNQVIDLTSWRGWAMVALFLLVCASARNVRHARWHRLNVALLILSTVGLQLLAPNGEFSYLLYVTVGIIGASTPAHRLHYVALLTIPGTVALVTFQEPTFNVFNAFGVALSFAMTFFLPYSFVSLKKSRDEQMRLFEELQQAHAELQAQAAQAEELATLHERTRLARDLHDTLGHALSTITVQLEAVRRVAGRHPEKLGPMLEDAQTLARQANRDLRQSLSDLRDAVPEKAFTDVLSDLAKEFSAQHGWKLELSLQKVSLPPQSAQALLSVAKEALTNAARHARAQCVTVALETSDDEVVLTIHDDGKGFNPDMPRSGHFGIQGMRERLSLLGGSLIVKAGVGQGAIVTASLPLKARPRELEVA